MTDRLPPNLLALFAPRPPLRYIPPIDAPPEQRRTTTIDGVAGFKAALEEYKDKDGYVATESWLQRRDRKKAELADQVARHLKEGPAKCEFSAACVSLLRCDLDLCD